MTEDEWMHHNPRPTNVQHGQERPRPLRPLDALWISVAAIIVAGVVVFGAVSAIGGGV